MIEQNLALVFVSKGRLTMSVAKLEAFVRGQRRIPNLRVSGQRGHSYIIQDGYLKYKVDLAPCLACQCQTVACPHLLYLLKEVLGLSQQTVIYLILVPAVYDHFQSLLKAKDSVSDLEGSLTEAIKHHFKDEPCGVCLDPLSASKYKMILESCTICNKWVHKACQDRWSKKCQKGSVTCVYCNLSSGSA